jgi:hypothetical protein
MRARALAEEAFFHPSVMSISYASIEHYFAIYMVSTLLDFYSLKNLSLIRFFFDPASK